MYGELWTPTSSGIMNECHFLVSKSVYIVYKTFNVIILKEFCTPSNSHYYIVLNTLNVYHRNSLLRLEYTISPPGGLDLASVDRNAMIVQINGRLNTTEVFRVSGNHVYQGTILGPEVIFTLDIVGEVTTEDYTQLEEAITVTWLQKNPGNVHLILHFSCRNA